MQEEFISTWQYDGNPPFRITCAGISRCDGSYSFVRRGMSQMVLEYGSGGRLKPGKVWLGNPFSGLGGSVYLEACRPVKLPLGNRMGKYLAAEVEIPAAWRGKTIMLQLETPSDWIDAVMVGDRYFASPRFRRPGCRFELNITREVVPGRKVRIELWGRAFPNSEWPQNPLPETGVVNLDTALIGCR